MRTQITSKKVIVGFYLKGKPKDYRIFDSYSQAQGFMQGLSLNPECESYGVERRLPLTSDCIG